MTAAENGFQILNLHPKIHRKNFFKWKFNQILPNYISQVCLGKEVCGFILFPFEINIAMLAIDIFALAMQSSSRDLI